MKCKICGIDFNIEMAEKGCQNCPFSGICRKVKCPFCGYENIPENIKTKRVI